MAVQLGDTRKVLVFRQPLEFTWRHPELMNGELTEAVAAHLADELRFLIHLVAARSGRRRR